MIPRSIQVFYLQTIYINRTITVPSANVTLRYKTLYGKEYLFKGVSFIFPPLFSVLSLVHLSESTENCLNPCPTSLCC